MASTDWEEVKKLAADFQRAQLTSNLQRLTEGNCVEIIMKLQKLRLLDVVFTSDGKTFITQQHLIKEIEDELYISGGRRSIIDIAKSLNVDVGVIESLVQTLLKANNKLCLILGHLIDQSYINHVADEINDKLQQYGRISVNDLTRTYDLPGNFIHTIIKDNMSKIISNTKQDKQDQQMYYTDSYFNRNRSVIKGAILAVTKPTLVINIMNHCSLPEHTFYSLIDSLIDLKQIPGFLTDRSSTSCTYIPNGYIKSQTELVKNSFKQNGYLEYKSLSRAGLSEPKVFIAKVLTEEKLTYLQNFVIGQQMLDNVEAAIEDAVLVSHSWIDVGTTLPISFELSDIDLIIELIMKQQKFSSSSVVFASSFIVSNAYLITCNAKITEQLVIPKAKDIVSSGKYELHVMQYHHNQINKSEPEMSRKEERKKKASAGKSGGGTQGRETKTKSVKKKYGQKNTGKVHDNDDEDDRADHSNNLTSLEIISIDELRDFVIKIVSNDEGNEIDDMLIDELINHFFPFINKKALNECKSLYEEHMQNVNNSRRKTNSALQDSMLTLYQDVKLYQKGIKQFTTDEDDNQLQLNKYLLKTTGTQLVNTCFTFISESKDSINSAEERTKILSRINDKDIHIACSKLLKSLSGNSVDEFLSCIEDTFSILNIMIKKLDKKKEKTILESHRTALIDKLTETDNPALVLHLVCLILYQDVTQHIINASGRFVASLLSFLKEKIQVEAYSLLNEYHSLVMKILVLEEDDKNYIDTMEKLKAITPEMKYIVHERNKNK